MDQIGADLAEAVERHLTEYGVRVLGGLSALNSAHPESLDLEIDAHPSRSLPSTFLTCRQRQHCRPGIPPALVRRCLWWARVCIRRALKRCGLADSGTSTELGTLICGTRVACSSTCAADGQLCPHNRAPSVTDCTADRVTRLPPSARRLSAYCLTHRNWSTRRCVRSPRAPASRSVWPRRRWIRCALPASSNTSAPAAGWCAPMSCWTCGRLPIRGSGPGQQTPGRQW